jgi:hypothetical protein
MGQGRFVNQKMGKKTGFAPRQAAAKTASRRGGMAQEKAVRNRRNERAIMKLTTIPSDRSGN